LIVTADDFGLADEVNDAVETAHRQGILTAASLMVGAPAAADAVDRARRMPGLRVGLHLVLVEGRPVLPPERLPDLVDATAHFRTDMVRLGFDIFARPSVRRQVRAEIDAQFRAFQATGLALDHVNAHKHFHVHPTVASETIAAAVRYGAGG
jgi:hopanoid biosynthesis associated protein HpnK